MPTFVGRRKDSVKQKWKDTQERKEFHEAGPLLSCEAKRLRPRRT